MRVEVWIAAAAAAVLTLSSCTPATTAIEAAPGPSTPGPPSTFAPISPEPPPTFVRIVPAELPAPTSTTAAPPAPPAAPSHDGPAPAAPPGEGAQQLVDQLTVAPEGSRDGYDRDLFDHWIDASANACHTRCEVLNRQKRYDLPGLPNGGWFSLYEGYTTDDPSELDIDHVVALGEAWRSGASHWDGERRRAFANDLEPGALLAVSASMNRSKGDRDPAQWQPPNREGWCEYGIAWTTTKLRWQLTADEAEVGALRNMLAGC